MGNLNNKPKPDDRSDNVEKLQEMVHNTIENMEEAEETMHFSDGEEKAPSSKKMKDAGKASKECVPKFKMKQLPKKTTNTNNEEPANAGFFYFVYF